MNLNKTNKMQQACVKHSLSFLLSMLLLFSFSNAWAQSCPAHSPLNSARTFSVLGGSAVTNTGTTTVIGNLGVSPSTTITGLGSVVLTGSMHQADAVAIQAQADVTNIYNTLSALPFDMDLSGIDLGTLVLTPGVYRFSSSAQLTGTLTLNTLGDPDALFVFQIGSTLTTASASSINLIGGSNDNIFWVVGSSATFGTTTAFRGNVLASASITVNYGARIQCGRALARTGAVTLDSAYIEICNQDCLVPVCGDGILQAGEECDDGNINDTDACNNSCFQQVQDCNGSFGGAAVLDNCGVCNGDGYSCNACVETNNLPNQFILDSASQKLQNIVIKSTRAVIKQGARDKALLKFVRSIRQQAKELHLISWQVAWSIPSQTQACDQSVFCVETSHEDLVLSFLSNSKKLSRLVTRTVTKLRALSENEKLGQKYLVAAKKEIRRINSVAAQISTSDTQCS